MNDVGIRDGSIDLDQFLKLAGAVGSGGQAKTVIQGGRVKVNGEVELRRRRALKPGDTVEIDGAPTPWRVAKRGP